MDLAWENLSDPIFHYAQERPRAPAVVEGLTRLSYRQLATLVGKASLHLHELGIKSGEFVGVVAPSTTDHLILAFALIRIGAVPVDIPMRRPANADPCKRFGIKRVFAAPGVTVPGDATIYPLDGAWREAIEATKGKTLDHRRVLDPDAVAYFNFTSGSTGVPKGVLTTHRQWMARFQAVLEMFPEIYTPDRPPNLLTIGGMSFSAFFFFLANQLCIGGTTVLMTEDHRPGYLAKALASWDDAVCLIVPALCRDFLAAAPAEGVLFPKMRALFIGAAPLFPEEKRQAVQRLTRNLYEAYGSAASGFLAALRPADILGKAESVGHGAAGIEIEIVDAQGDLMPTGRVGHLRCRGPGVSQGFFEADAAQGKGPEGFREGWYYPGDLAALEADGYVYVKGRVSDIVLRRGVEIFPTDIEQVLASHPSIVEAAVFGAALPGQEEQLIAFVVPHGAPQREALAQHCRRHLTAATFPDRVFFTDALPRTDSGKLDRPRLKAAYLRDAKPAKDAVAAR